MPLLREVEVYPPSGFARKPWSDDPDEDAFARISHSICETYSVALPALGLPTKASLLRLNCLVSILDPAFAAQRPWPKLSDPPAAAIRLNDDFIESFEMGTIWVPHGFSSEPVPTRKEWTLAVIHEAARQLVKIRGGDPTPLDEALAYTLGQDLRYLHHGPWKSAPGRRHKARALARLEDNGMGTMWLEIIDAAGTLVAQSDPALASCDGIDLVRACKLVTWSSPKAVSVLAPQDPYGIRQSVIGLTHP